MMDPAGSVLMTGTDPNPGSRGGPETDPNPGSRHGSLLDPNPGHPGHGAPDGVVMQALATTRAAIVRPDRKGGGDDPPPSRRPARPNLWQLDGDLLVTVVQKEIGQRLMVIDRTLWLTGTPTPDGSMSAPALKLLTIAGPDPETDIGRQTLAAQCRAVLKRAEERPDRMAEIQVQVVGLWPFFSAITHVVPSRAPVTSAVVAIVSALVSAIAQQFKHQIACPRPIDCSASVQPVIATPSHASLPNAHAATAFAMQATLDALLGLPANDLGARTMRRLARRIADNRVVAGVHFPMDGCAGWLLARTLTEVVTALASRRQIRLDRNFTSDDPRFRRPDPTAGDLPPGDAEWDENDVPGCSRKGRVARPKAIPDLQAVWEAAEDELRALGLRR